MKGALTAELPRQFVEESPISTLFPVPSREINHIGRKYTTYGAYDIARGMVRLAIQQG